TDVERLVHTVVLLVGDLGQRVEPLLDVDVARRAREVSAAGVTDASAALLGDLEDRDALLGVDDERPRRLGPVRIPERQLRHQRLPEACASCLWASPCAAAASTSSSVLPRKPASIARFMRACANGLVATSSASTACRIAR